MKKGGQTALGYGLFYFSEGPNYRIIWEIYTLICKGLTGGSGFREHTEGRHQLQHLLRLRL